MAISPIHNFFAYNNEIKPVSCFIYGENEGGIYEVIRVVEGVPLFLGDHLSRFFVSAEIAGKKIRYSKTEIGQILNTLIASNKINNGNILVSCKHNLKAFFIHHTYPSDEFYVNGINCGILHGERQNPNAKVFQTTVRQQADDLMAKKKFYEVLLVDQLGRITEGSRSNVFFVDRNSIITPPGNEVLLGITRNKTFLLAKELGFRLAESDVYTDDLEKFDSAFLTGTSPKILPVRYIENLHFNPDNEIVKQLIHSYNDLIERYISNTRKVGLKN